MRAPAVALFASALACALATAACGDKHVDELERVKHDVCTCKTVACGEAALAEVPKDNVESNHRTQGIARDMLDCMAKLYEDERPSTDPDAPQGDGSDDGSGPAPAAGSAIRSAAPAPAAHTP
jgi:hypothetical protein